MRSIVKKWEAFNLLDNCKSEVEKNELSLLFEECVNFLLKPDDKNLNISEVTEMYSLHIIKKLYIEYNCVTSVKYIIKTFNSWVKENRFCKDIVGDFVSWFISKKNIIKNNDVSPFVRKRFSDNELIKMALEMIYQMTGEKVPKEEQCRWQGNSNYQIAMTYFEKINNGW